jgi:hypothetical protein
VFSGTSKAHDATRTHGAWNRRARSDRRSHRGFSTTTVFWDFVGACRNSLARVEAEQVIL